MWDGGTATLQARAIDEFGRAQPTRDELIAARGKNPIYHYSAIQSWGVGSDGVIKNVFA